MLSVVSQGRMCTNSTYELLRRCGKSHNVMELSRHYMRVAHIALLKSGISLEIERPQLTSFLNQSLIALNIILAFLFYLHVCIYTKYAANRKHPGESFIDKCINITKN